MPKVDIERRDDGWYLIPDWEGQPEKIVAVSTGPHDTKSEALEAQALYERAFGGTLTDPASGPARRDRSIADRS